MKHQDETAEIAIIQSAFCLQCKRWMSWDEKEKGKKDGTVWACPKCGWKVMVTKDVS